MQREVTVLKKSNERIFTRICPLLLSQNVTFIKLLIYSIFSDRHRKVSITLRITKCVNIVLSQNAGRRWIHNIHDTCWIHGYMLGKRK